VRNFPATNNDLTNLAKTHANQTNYTSLDETIKMMANVMEASHNELKNKELNNIPISVSFKFGLMTINMGHNESKE
jgi:hypothetical protein